MTPLFDRPVAAAFRRAWPVVGLALLCLGLALGGDVLREWCRYDRQALLAGQFWRLASGHLVHLGWSHVWLNLAALGVIAVLFDDVLAARDWLVAMTVSAAAIDVGLFFLHERVVWYVGLSGVLHGLVVAGALALVLQRSPAGMLLLAGVTAKLLWEQWAGPLPFSESTSGGPVIVHAHLYGALGGTAALLQLGRRPRARRL